jgi:hypothetical protein
MIVGLTQNGDEGTVIYYILENNKRHDPQGKNTMAVTPLSKNLELIPDYMPANRNVHSDYCANPKSHTPYTKFLH